MTAAIAFILSIIIADQAVKSWALNYLSEVDTIPLIKDVFHLTYAENTGAAFSILSGKRWFFIIMTVVTVIVIAYLLKKGFFKGRLAAAACCMVIGGAIGNLIDRIVHGFVVDLFDFCLINFPIFNVADIFLTVGGGLWIVYFLFIDQTFLKKEGSESDGN